MIDKDYLKNTEVEVHLGRTSGGDGTRPWRLEVTDKRSRSRILELRMANDDFAAMMGNMAAGWDDTIPAEVFVAPWIGKYAVRHHETVDTTGIAYKELDERLRAMGEQAARDRRHDTGDEWKFTGYSGGGGGSRYRTLTFVKYVDEKP